MGRWGNKGVGAVSGSGAAISLGQDVAVEVAERKRGIASGRRRQCRAQYRVECHVRCGVRCHVQ